MKSINPIALKQGTILKNTFRLCLCTDHLNIIRASSSQWNLGTGKLKKICSPLCAFWFSKHLCRHIKIPTRNFNFWLSAMFWGITTIVCKVQIYWILPRSNSAFRNRCRVFCFSWGLFWETYVIFKKKFLPLCVNMGIYACKSIFYFTNA